MLGFLEGDLAAILRVPSFRLYALSRTGAGIGQSMLQAVIAWQVYSLSGSALDLGIVGLIRFVPAFVLSFISGVMVDTYDRQKMLLFAQSIVLLSSAVMLAALATDHVSLPLVYGIVFLAGVASAFEGPARQSLIPALVPRRLFSRAMTFNSTLQSICAVSGPALGGLLIAVQGVGLGYAVHFCLILLSMLALVPLRAVGMPVAAKAGVNLGAIRDGFTYLRSQPAMLGAMTLDMFAVLFGGAKALLPIYAQDILQVDAAGYGLLTASLEIGALLAALLLVAMPPPTHLGRALLLSVAAFGLATIVFGASTWLPLSIVAYAAVGAADQVSMVMRLNTIQLALPDELRGRVTAVNFVFVNASNQIGGLESGVVAELTSAMFAVVSGGFACLAVVGLVAWRIPELRKHRSRQAGASPASA